MGGSPIDRFPLLRVRRSDSGRWLPPEPILWLDRRNSTLAAKVGDRASLRGQPFGDEDSSQFIPGRAVVMRRKGGAGVVELIEVNVDGDTVWHRRLQARVSAGGG